MDEPKSAEAVQEQLMSAMTRVDACINDLIRIELREKLPSLEKAEADAAVALQTAIDNLAPCQEAIAALDEEIAAAEGMIASFSEVSYDSPMEDRVDVRHRFISWSAELQDLHRRRDIAEQEANPFEQAKHDAKNKLANAANERERLESAILYPRVGPALETVAYRAWRGFGGHLVPVLIQGPDAWEYDAALEWLDAFLDMIDYKEMTAQRARVAKHYQKQIYNDYQSRVTAPSGREVIDNDIAGLVSNAVNNFAREHGRGQIPE